ncbi:farsa-a, partial [Symbiodinium sp. KB8]
MESSLETQLLQALADGGSVNSLDFAETAGVPHTAVVGVMKSLQSDEFVVGEQLSRQHFECTEEGKLTLESGSPELRLFKAVPAEGASQKDLESALGKDGVKFGMSAAMRKRWLRVDKETKNILRNVEEVKEDETAEAVKRALNGDIEPSSKEAKELKKRNLVTVVSITYFNITKGVNFALERKKAVADFTKEMLDSGVWKTTPLKPVNLDALGKDVGGGHLHLLLKVRAEFRKVLLEMGFSEMPTNRFVESSFWNFDALFQPQSHPARDMHDTFFMKEPAATLTFPEDYLEKVKKVHEDGGYGSIGYGYKWKREEAMKNLLRTHTTAVSSRMLYELANQEGGFKPVKYFSIDRVFRNEALDATHLAEFHQIEGVVADRGLGLGDLIGVITEFFTRIGEAQCV